VIRRFDHVTIAVNDLDAAKAFFAALGFETAIDVEISGERMDAYMGVPGLVADHVTLVLANAAPRLEVQLLKFHQPEARTDPNIDRLDKIGFNHICFVVDDIDAEIARLKGHGVELRNSVMTFHDRKLVYLVGPEGVTIELAEWLSDGAAIAPAATGDGAADH